MAFKVPEKFRLKKGSYATEAKDGNNGVFICKSAKFKRALRCIASDGMDWEHVSVSLADRCPTWEEMCYIKSLFWGEDDLVLQYHPPKSDYVSYAEYCLHLWRPINTEVTRPPFYLVGPKAGGDNPYAK